VDPVDQVHRMAGLLAEHRFVGGVGRAGCDASASRSTPIGTPAGSAPGDLLVARSVPRMIRERSPRFTYRSPAAPDRRAVLHGRADDPLDQRRRDQRTRGIVDHHDLGARRHGTERIRHESLPPLAASTTIASSR